MFNIKRSTWFTIYGVAFAVMIGLSVTYGTKLAWGIWAALFGVFVVFTSPTPRNRADLYPDDPRDDDEDNEPCDCPHCTGAGKGL